MFDYPKPTLQMNTIYTMFTLQVFIILIRLDNVSLF